MSADGGRRRVLKALLLGAAGFAARPARAGRVAPIDGREPGVVPRGGGSGKSLVARARRDAMVGANGALDAARLQEAAGAAIARVAGETWPVEALRRWFTPRDVVGIKLNCLGGKGLSPDPRLVGCLTRWLQDAGVPGRNIVVFDLREPHLVKAGYTIVRASTGVRCFGINDDFEKSPREWGPGGSCFARILVEELTALVNVGVVKDHDLAGVSIGLKSWYGVIHNPNKHHDDGCQPYVAHLAAFPLIRDKVRLTIVDAAIAQCQGGPARNPRWSWPYRSVLASTDPVAVDAFGWSVIEARRKEVGLDTLAAEKREPRYIATAAKLGLGEADLSRIRVEDV